ncbi:MAG: hypothetical protein LBG04_03850 [Holosporaceae bacterium]|jgi:hypothetical protein|nr:hypothetical protein [Holosporaceae bacterium]
MINSRIIALTVAATATLSADGNDMLSSVYRNRTEQARVSPLRNGGMKYRKITKQDGYNDSEVTLTRHQWNYLKNSSIFMDIFGDCDYNNRPNGTVSIGCSQNQALKMRQMLAAASFLRQRSSN